MKLDQDQARNDPNLETATPVWRGLLRALSLSIALEIALRLSCAWCTSSQDEGVILRWMRVAADHPVRSGLAFSLGFMALLWPGKALPGPSRPAPW